MLIVQRDVMTSYEQVLNIRGIDAARHGDYRKWLRYFMDYSH